MPALAAVGPFPVLRLIATGGMSAVYEVADPASGTTYAAKVLDPRIADDPRFEQEYITLARVNHPNIVRALRYGRTVEGAPYLVLELIFGATAQARAKAIGRPGEPSRTAEAARIAHDVASALAHMHTRGLIHRDLKSNNVIVSAEGTVKLLDFGTVRLVRGGLPITRRGDFVGTFAYASPEQLTARPIDFRSDLYSLGVLFYRMLTGKKPFDAETPEAIARQHLEFMPPPPVDVVPAIPPELSSIVMALLQKDPDARPSNARVVVEWLKPFLPAPARHAAPARIGRGDQLARVDEALSAQRPGTLVLFSGPADAEPLHHLRRAADEAARFGMRVLRFDLTEGGFEALHAGLSELEPTLLQTPADAAPEVLDAAILAAASVTTADRVPLVLAVTGTERARPDRVVRLLGLVARAKDGAAPILVLSTWGTKSVDQPGATVVQVAPLTPAELVEVARRRLGVDGIPPERVQRWLHLSAGRPSVVEELLEVATDRGPVEVPAGLEARLLADVSALPRVERRVLEAITAVDGLLDVMQLAWVVDLPEDDVAVAADALGARGWVRMREGHPQVSFGALAEVARRATRQLRYYLYCRRAVDRLGDAPASATVARIRADAGQADAAVRTLVRWGEGALAEGRATAVRNELAPYVARHPGLLSPAGWRVYASAAATSEGPLAEAERAVQEAADRATSPLEKGEVAVVAARLARRKGVIDHEIRKLTESIRAFEAAGARDRADASRLALAETLRRLGELDRAEVEARAAHNHPRYSAVIGAILLDRGELESSVGRFDEAFERDRAGAEGPWRSAVGLVRALRALGRWSDGYRVLNEVLPRARAEAAPRRLARLLIAEAELAVDLHRLGQARDDLDETRAIFGGRVPDHLIPAVARVESRINLLVGEEELAQRIVDDALEHAVRGSFGRAAAELRGLRAAIVAARDGADGVRREFSSARDALQVYGAFTAMARMCAVWAEVTAGADAPDWIYRGVSGWIDRQPALPARLERALAWVRYARRRNEPVENRRLDAFLLLDQLREGLSPEDAGALDVHPYSVELRRG